jgi:hypothetical protein
VEENLIPLGRGLREALLPEEILDRMTQVPGITHLMFECDPRLNGVPYDGMFLWDDFVCFRFGTGKQLLAQRPVRRAEARSLPYLGCSVVDPGQLIASTALLDDFEEFQQQRSTPSARERIDFSTCHIGEPVDRARMHWLFQNRELINIITHHEYDIAQPSRSGYQLDQVQRFTGAELRDCLRGADTVPLLLFSVACEAGITKGWEEHWPRTTVVYGIVDAALQAGIRHYVGTHVKIPQHRSVQVLKKFYSSLERGDTVGQALRQARVAYRPRGHDVRDGGTALGLSFLLYGDPARSYFCADGHRTDAVETVLCEEPVEGGFCLRAVCQREAGFAQRRCTAYARSTDRCCQLGHEILAGVYKVCAGEQERHPGKRHLVCPLDPGWMQGLCQLCLRR